MTEKSTGANTRMTRTATLALGALGIVYGDIGTSPLYAVKECFHGLHGIAVNETNVLGILSLIFWALIIVITIKYVIFVMQADNKQEGGVFSLLALIRSASGKKNRVPYHRILPYLALLGAALLYSDGVITPAVSVLSAVEGLSMAAPGAEPYMVPMTCTVLFVLFMSQRFGTHHIGRLFGPVMVLWFGTLAFLGVLAIIKNPVVLAAINPFCAVEYFQQNHMHGVIALGSVVLCITGGEALYADMGHFGHKPIGISWIGMVLPALVLNYFGQGATILASPELAVNPFYSLVPMEYLYPMVALSTLATVIASQAMISGVFSLTQQAIQMGFLPRMRIVHTSADTRGQIYMPTINTMLMCACIALVLGFESSSALAGAYGLAVTAAMCMTSFLFFAVIREVWGWSLRRAVPLLALFLCFDIPFLSANLLKIADGGWFTLLLALCVMTVMLTWRDGRAILAGRFAEMSLPMNAFLKAMQETPPARSPGTGVFMSVSPTGTPVPLMRSLALMHSVPERIILLTIPLAGTPYVDPEKRLKVEALGDNIYRVLARYGYMETPSVAEIAQLSKQTTVSMPLYDTTFYLGRESLLIGDESSMMHWRKRVFAFMSRNSWNASTFFNIPSSRVMEIGSQVVL